MNYIFGKYHSDLIELIFSSNSHKSLRQTQNKRVQGKLLPAGLFPIFLKIFNCTSIKIPPQRSRYACTSDLITRKPTIGSPSLHCSLRGLFSKNVDMKHNLFMHCFNPKWIIKINKIDCRIQCRKIYCLLLFSVIEDDCYQWRYKNVYFRFFLI